MRASWLLFRTLALSHLATHRLRVALSGVGISLGVMLLFAALIGNGSLTQSFADTRRSLYGTPDIEVLGASPGGIDEAMLAQAARTPGVAVASPLLVERTLAKGPSRAAEVIVVGFDNRLLAQAPAAANPKQLRLVGRGVGLTVPQQLLDELGVTGTGDMRLGILADGVLHRIPVVAVAPPALGAQLNGGHAVGVPLQLAQQIFHQPGRLSAIGIKTQPHWRAATVYTSLSYLFDNNADVVFGNEQQRELDAATSQQRGLTNFLSLLALLLGAMVLYSTTSMTAVERRRDFAIMLALGESPTALLLRFLGEAAVIGLFGSAVGLAGGWLLGHYLVGTTPRFIEDAYGFSTRFIVPTWAPLTAFAGGVLMAVLAAAVPALGLRRIPPAEALRPQAVGEPAPDRRLRVVATLVGTVLAAGGLLATLVAPRVGLQGVSVMFLGMALVAPAVLSVVVRAVARALIGSRFRGAAGVAQIAAADLVQAPGRTVAAASAVAFALGMVLALRSMGGHVSTMGK